jgi:hypothetical protein
MMTLAAATPVASNALPVPAAAPALPQIAIAEPTFTFGAADLKLTPLG